MTVGSEEAISTPESTRRRPRRGKRQRSRELASQHDPNDPQQSSAQMDVQQQQKQANSSSPPRELEKKSVESALVEPSKDGELSKLPQGGDNRQQQQQQQQGHEEQKQKQKKQQHQQQSQSDEQQQQQQHESVDYYYSNEEQLENRRHLLQDNQRPSFGVDWSELRGRRYIGREFLDCCNQFRYNCGMFVNNPVVQFVVIILISVNAIMMGIATFPLVSDDPYLFDVFERVDLIFLIIFTVELFLQFIYHGWRILCDGWLVFDLVIIVTSWSFAQVQIVRAFRIFRALRLVTRIKTMKNLILALFGVMPRLAAIGLMLALIFYIFAVMFTQLFKDEFDNDDEEERNFFGGMDTTLFTLYQMMTLDQWADIARQYMKKYIWAWIPFVVFVIISGFIVVNLIIAVICDAISALKEEDRARLEGTFEDEGNSDSEDVSSQELEIREQLDSLEFQMEELTRMQAQSFHTLQYLTRQLQMHKLRAELKNSQHD